MHDVSGNIVGLHGTLQDITDKKKIQERMRQDKQFVDTLMDSLPGVVFLFDANGKFLKWNKVLENVAGYSMPNLLG